MGKLPSATLAAGWRVVDVVDEIDGVRVILADADGRHHELTADYTLGCDGSGGVTRRSIGAHYECSTGSLPNVSITFRSQALEERELCALGVHYWVIGAAYGGLMGRLDLDGNWWAIVQGVDASQDDVDPAGPPAACLAARWSFHL
ncbi:2-polyprenyl-6-methoxyphenol hydroxylase-like FAD-dependent oxidoreductase [Nakamurella sp. UYEF19]|uniref:FAD-dependent monooxygenase n=1 Tax=Nakamurella sp. UYEF19 TaxID=1756392 RepID=UPI003394A943